jgi:hypothetical protein
VHFLQFFTFSPLPLPSSVSITRYTNVPEKLTQYPGEMYKLEISSVVLPNSSLLGM